MAALEHRLSDTRPGEIVETRPAAAAIMTEIAGRIAGHGGVALIVDYGDWRSRGDTLQAVRAHQPVAVLDTPGEADLTAHVDFEALAAAARGCAVTQMIPQGVVLERLGIVERARALAAALDGAALESHIAAFRRLTHSDEMGTLFKTLGLSQEGSPQIPGFSPWP